MYGGKWVPRAGVVVLVLAFGALVPGTAFAHHPEITGSVRCPGTVTFRVASWAGRPDDPATVADERRLSRTQEQVILSYSLDGGRTFVLMPIRRDYQLTAGNGFDFRGEFSLPAGASADSVILRAKGVGRWANGMPGEPRTTPPLPIPECGTSEAAVLAGGTDGPDSSPPTREAARAGPVDRVVGFGSRSDLVWTTAAALGAAVLAAGAGLWVVRRLDRP